MANKTGQDLTREPYIPSDRNISRLGELIGESKQLPQSIIGLRWLCWFLGGESLPSAKVPGHSGDLSDEERVEVS